MVAHDSPSHRKSWAKHGTHSWVLPLACHLPLPLLQRLHPSPPLTESARPLLISPTLSSPLRIQPTSISRSPPLRARYPIPPPPPPPLTKPPPYPNPVPPSYPPPIFNHPPCPTTVSVGTAGVPLALSPPTRPSPPSFLTPRSGPTLTRRSPTALAPSTRLPGRRRPPLYQPLFHVGEGEGTMQRPPADFPHAITHRGGACGVSSPPVPTIAAPLTHGAERVDTLSPHSSPRRAPRPHAVRSSVVLRRGH
jgi:hypothetical protein